MAISNPPTSPSSSASSRKWLPPGTPFVLAESEGSLALGMEHLHYRDADQIDPLLVPYYGAVEYDGGDWATYTERAGYSPAFLYGLRNPDDSLDPGAERLSRSVLQEWLWFGVLHEFCNICGTAYDRKDFISRDGRHLNTEALPLLAEEILRAQIDSVVRADNPAYVANIKESVRERFGFEGVLTKEYLENSVAQQKAGPLFRMECYASHIAQDDPAVLLRERRLIECLTLAGNALKAMFARYWHEQLKSWDAIACFSSCVLVESLLAITYRLRMAPYSRVRIELPIHIDPIYKLIAPKSGQCIWCVGRYSTGQMSQDYVSMTMIKRNDTSHAACAPLRCNPAGPDPYAGLPGHSVNCSGTCSLLDLPTLASEKLKTLYDDGKYGVLLVSTLADGSIELDVTEASKGLEYVCISHVWSHGLGNPHGNAIFRCQLAVIIERARQVYPSAKGAFWLDTLCVPLTQPHRRIAISCMNAVYKGAAAVLVLDRELLRVGNSFAEQASRLLLCDWMQRLWTLAEALLAHDRLWVAYGSEAKTLAQLHESILNDPGLKARVLLEKFSNQIAYEFRISSDRPRLLLDLAELFHRRITSHAADEPICLAGLLGLDLMALPAKLTLRDVFSALASQGLLSSDIIFSPGPRMAQDGFGWAPESLLGQVEIGYNAQQEPATLTDKGLCIVKDGFLANGEVSVEFQAWNTNHHDIPFFAILDEGGIPTHYFHFDNLEEHDSERVKHPAFIFLGPDSTATVMVSRLHEDTGCWHARYITRFSTTPAAAFEAQRDMRRVSVTNLSGSRAAGVKWCIH